MNVHIHYRPSSKVTNFEEMNFSWSSIKLSFGSKQNLNWLIYYQEKKFFIKQLWQKSSLKSVENVHVLLNLQNERIIEWCLNGKIINCCNYLHSWIMPLFTNFHSTRGKKVRFTLFQINKKKIQINFYQQSVSIFWLITKILQLHKSLTFSTF